MSNAPCDSVACAQAEMGRTKRTRTREEIEQAMRDNERINATSAGPEEPAAKTRRQGYTASTVTTVESHVAVGNRPAAPPPVHQEQRVVPTVAPVVLTVAAAVVTTREQVPILTSAEAGDSNLPKIALVSRLVDPWFSPRRVAGFADLRFSKQASAGFAPKSSSRGDALAREGLRAQNR
ncbi:hypothetical protein ON010_g1009 [Phytophthora cinnamomi]|nr:hypothetical protein ON010_g1009 [Phytophthora cinnamomi]